MMSRRDWQPPDTMTSAYTAVQNPILFDGHIGLSRESAYSPGYSTSLVNKSIIKTEGRMYQFGAEVSGFGECIFTLTENAVIDKETGFGVFYGRITSKSSQDFLILNTKSVGMLYTNNGPEGIGALEFRGEFGSIGKSNAARETGTYGGYFIPDKPSVSTSGFLHIEFNF